MPGCTAPRQLKGSMCSLSVCEASVQPPIDLVQPQQPVTPCFPACYVSAPGHASGLAPLLRGIFVPVELRAYCDCVTVFGGEGGCRFARTTA
eukprot:366131-Chlamydomonas_euryale.AAC.26